VIAADTVYEGAAVGLVPAPAWPGRSPRATASRLRRGHRRQRGRRRRGDQRPRDRERARSSSRSAGATITDVGQPVYATDDDTFVFSPVAAVFVGFVHRFVSAGVVVVPFDAPNYRDPYGARTGRAITISADTTLDIEDTGKLFWVDTDAFIITLPAVATGLDNVQDRQRRRPSAPSLVRSARTPRTRSRARHHRRRRQGPDQHQGDRAARRLRQARRQRRRRLRSCREARHLGARGLEPL
jgi:hypothetical protein